MRLTLLDALNPGDAARETIDAPQAWSRPKPEFVADLSGRALRHNLFHAERTRHGTDRVHFGAVQLHGSHHFHAVLDKSGRMAVQESAPERVRFRLEHHLANPPPAGAAVPRILGEPPMLDLSAVAGRVTPLPGPAFFASPTEPDNWGMWLLSLLPSVADWQARGGKEHLLCWVRFAWQKRLLEFLGVGTDRLVVQHEWQVYAAPALTMHQYSAVDLAPTATDRAIFQRIAAKCGPARSEKLFVSRKGFGARFGHRRLLNEDELITALSARGFRIVEPETLPFREQVRLFSGARLVVGLGGAAMFSTVFCAPGTAVISIESGTGYADNHANLFAGLGHRYGFIFGQEDATDPAPAHRRWTLDVARAARHIDAF